MTVSETLETLLDGIENTESVEESAIASRDGLIICLKSQKERIAELEKLEAEDRLKIEILQGSENKYEYSLKICRKKYFIKIKTLFMYPATITMLVI